MRKFFASLIFALILTTGGVVFAYSSPGNPTGFVNDYSGVFTEEERSALEAKLSQFEQASTNEISVVIINSLDGDSIENFAENLFEEWGIGKAETDNGVLLLVAKDDREMRIEVGYGLEGSLTDLLSSRIIRETLTPAFRENDFYGGITKAVDQIEKITYGEVPLELQKEEAPNIEGYFNYFIFGFIALSWISSILARSKSWWAGGVVGLILGIILSIFFGFMVFGLISIFILTPLGLLFDFLVSRAYKNSKSGGTRPPWWAGGGGFGGGGSSGSSFGGFSGGSSGGGGSSGSW